MAQPLPPLRDVIARHGLQAKKSLGQHFLLDAHLTDSIAGYAGDLRGYTVIEIGPGPGGLTRSLLATAAERIIAVEKDDRCVSALQALQAGAGSRLEIMAADALRVDLSGLCPPPRAIVANLPYNVGTALLLRWLEDIWRDPGCYDRLIVMFQREVAERLTAEPGCRAYGRLSVLTQWLCEAAVVQHVPAAAFTPPPKVDSAVVRLIPRAAPRYAAAKEPLERVVQTAFQQRRKMLRTALKPLGAAVIEQLPALGITPTLRADQVSIEQYCRLSHALHGVSDGITDQ